MEKKQHNITCYQAYNITTKHTYNRVQYSKVEPPLNRSGYLQENAFTPMLVTVLRETQEEIRTDDEVIIVLYIAYIYVKTCMLIYKHTYIHGII